MASTDQTGRRAVESGQKRLAGLMAAPNGGMGWVAAPQMLVDQ